MNKKMTRVVAILLSAVLVLALVSSLILPYIA